MRSVCTRYMLVGVRSSHAMERLPPNALSRLRSCRQTGSHPSLTVLRRRLTRILDAERSKLRNLWQASDERPQVNVHTPWAGDSPLPPLTPDDLRKASRTFSEQTSSTYDGFHPRHFSLMSDPALETLGILFQAIECLGEMPQSNSQVIVALIAKATGGTRPIGLYPGSERLWAKARLPISKNGRRST